MKRSLRKLERHNPFEDRTPVHRRRVAQYLLITLLSFAASVSLTRVFLEITGYPKLGAGEIHIAHVLWGGLMLFFGAILPLIFMNEWVLRLSALLTGLGIGLFIDEVGKFITQTNDYFHPAAAPIVYVFFLLTVLLFVIFRRKRKSTVRVEMYQIMDQFSEGLDHDLSPDEYHSLLKRLDGVITGNESKPLVDLAENLRNYLLENYSRLVPENPKLIDRIRIEMLSFEKRFLSRKVHKRIVLMGLALWSAWTLYGAATFLRLFRDAQQLSMFIERLIENRLASSARGFTWFEVRVLMEGGVGILVLLAALLLLLNAEKQGILLAVITLLISLTIVTPMVFYYDQFSTVIEAAIQFALLILVIRYRTRFLT